MTRLIIGFAGEAGSGKDAVARHMREKYGASIFMFLDTNTRPTHKVASSRYARESRRTFVITPNLVWGGFVGKVVTEDIKGNLEALTVVTGIRRREDIERLRGAGDFRLIYVEARPEIRYDRVHRRSQNEDDKTKTFEEFRKDGELETERTIRDLKSDASAVLENNGSFEELYRACDALMGEWLHV